jgi:hypothetical protein
VQLGHASESAVLYVCTYPRSRFDTVMTQTGDSPLREVACAVTHQMVNRVLTQAGVTGPQRDSLRRVAVHYAENRAAAYQSWQTAGWHVITAEPAGGEIPARITSLAGWQSGFAATADSYIAAHGYGTTLDDISLRPVLDSAVYGFAFVDAVLPQNVPPSVPGNEVSETLHNDLALMLTAELAG